MSLKPPKKTDLSKTWMTKRESRNVRMHPEYHLIVTEGTKTEPLYFGAFRDSINKNHKGRIRLDICGTGMNTLSIVDRAVTIVKNSPNQYKHVWIVYDTDDFPSEDIDSTEKVCKELSAKDKDSTVYHALWSNQCIELWFLLHFDFMHSDLQRHLYYPKLSSYLKKEGKEDGYRKNREDMFSILKPYINNAIRNAEKLEKQNHGKLPSSSAPGTKVYMLFDRLKSYL